jgi:hypothetical protein
MNQDEEKFEHKVDAWTVGQLRAALDGVSDDLPVVCWVAEEPGGKDICGDQVVFDAGFGQVDWGKGEGLQEDKTKFGLSLEFPPGTYYRPKAGH